jgi:C-terminal peptidase prc
VFVLTLLFVRPASASTEGSKISCEDFSKIFGFVQMEHLRFFVMKPEDVHSLLKTAIEGIPEKMRDQGYAMMAAQFEMSHMQRLLAQKFSNPYEICASLPNSLSRVMMLKSFVNQLDPYSDFYLTEEMARKASVVNGHFVGVGIGTKPEDPYLKITEVVDEGPAFGKLKAGDKVSHIDNYPVRGLSLEELRRRIRGELDTKVVFKGLRASKEGEDSEFEVTVKRGHVFQKSLTTTWQDDGIVHLKIHRFFAQTSDQIRQVISQNREKIRGIILDLQDNPGGLLQGARDVVDLFVSHGVVVYLRGVYDDQLWAPNDGGFTDIPMVVLVNEKTASASEIVAGALQDYGRALLVGRQTFGKSCVQNIYDTQSALGINYEGGLKLTTLWYYLPSGRSVKSLRPDILVPYKEGEDEPSRINMPYEWPEKIQVYPFAQAKGKSFKDIVEQAKSKLQALGATEDVGAALIRRLLAVSTEPVN